MTERLHPGQRVLVRALAREGVVVDSLGQQYRVAIGALTMTCRRAELDAVRTGTPSKRRSAAAVAPQHPDTASATSVIDLHGRTTEEARAALLAHLDTALRAGHARVEVIHGIGTGRVRAAVLETLRGLPSIRAVHPHPTNRGVTIVEL